MDNSKYKDHNDGMNIPPELQWHNMEDKIIDKMNQLEGKKRKRRRFFLIFFFGLLALTTIVVMQLFTNNPSQSTLSHAHDIDAQDLKSQTMMEAYTQIASNEATTEISTFTNINEMDQHDAYNPLHRSTTIDAEYPNKAIEVTSYSTKQEQQKNMDDNSVPNDVKTYSKVENININEAISPFLNLSQNTSELIEENISDKFPEGNNPSFPHISKNSIVDAAEIKETSDRLSDDEIPYINTLNPMITPSGREVPLCALDIESPSIDLYNRHVVTLLTGATTWSSGYGAILPQRSAYEQNVSSYFLSGAYTYNSPKRWTFMTGITLQNLVTKFNYSEILQDYPITLADVVIHINQNAISGGQSIERGNVTVEVEAARNVTNYNTIRSIQVPVSFGYAVDQGRWRIAAAVGTAFNIINQHKGKTIFKNIVTEYDNNFNQIISTNITSAWLANGQLTYWLRPHWGVTAAFQYQSSLNNITLEENVIMKPRVLQMGLGINYKL